MRCLLFVLGLVACTHHRPLRAVHEVEGDVEVEASGQTFDAVAVPAGPGKSFVVRSGGSFTADEVTTVKDVRHGQGAVEGLGLGFLVGAGIGAVVGYAGGDDHCSGDHDCFLEFSAGDKALLGGVVLGVLGAGAGLIVGAAMGATYIYEGGDAPVVRPVGPPGSVAGLTVAW